MFRSAHNRLLVAGALIAAVALPATLFASDASFAATISAEPVFTPLPLDASIIDSAADSTDTDGTRLVSDSVPDQAELECMAKVVLHEAGNQPRAGQLAVAQLLVNRMESGRFADTICGVVNQRNQFFQTASYNPRRDTAGWANALSVSREALEGATADVVPGAMFFRAAYAPASGFFRGRTRVVTLGDHVFYR